MMNSPTPLHNTVATTPPPQRRSLRIIGLSDDEGEDANASPEYVSVFAFIFRFSVLSDYRICDTKCCLTSRIVYYVIYNVHFEL